MRDFLELVTVTSIASSLIFGAMIGGLYGYALSHTHRPMFPFTLWSIGLAFIVLLGLLATSDSTRTGPGYAAGRATLWTLMCAAIPAGRWVRYRVTVLIRSRRGSET